MKSFFLSVLFVISCVASGFGGYYMAEHGYKVVTPNGGPAAEVFTNAADVVKTENMQLGLKVVGMSEFDAKQLLSKAHRTMFVGSRDGKSIEYVGQKTFTNLTVEIKGDKITKILGWY